METNDNSTAATTSTKTSDKSELIIGIVLGCLTMVVITITIIIITVLVLRHRNRCTKRIGGIGSNGSTDELDGGNDWDDQKLPEYYDDSKEQK